MIRRATALGAALSALLVAAAAASEIGARQLDALPRADIVILGEVHDNPAHHANQARAVGALEPAAIVFEMIPRDLADEIGTAAGTTRETLEKMLDWSGRGWPDFSMYYPIFTAAPEARIVAGDLPRGEIRLAMSEGAGPVFSERFGAHRARALGLTEPLPEPEQSAREAEQASAHCGALPEAMLPGMVSAQRLRDASLAQAVLATHDDTGGPVTLITGNGHARRDRVAAFIEHVAPELSVLTIGQLERAPDSRPPFDLWLVTGSVERPDPCADFQ